MSNLANFDMIFEISNGALLKMLKATWTISGNSANPPFEILHTINEGGVTGVAHFIVYDMELDLNADDTVAVILKFHNTSFDVSKPVTAIISKLDGELEVKTKLELSNGKTVNQKILSTNLGNAQTTLTFSNAAQAIINSAVQGLPISQQLVTAMINQQVDSFIKGLGVQSFPQEFKVVPGVDGSMEQFEKLEVHCIHNSDRKKQSLGFFGIVLAANHNNGNHQQKQSTNIQQGDQIALSIAPDAFQKLIFCPMLVEEFLPNEVDGQIAMAMLPTACGTSSGLSMEEDVTLKKIGCSFDNGHIDFDGKVEKSGFCYEATSTFHGEIELKYGYYFPPKPLAQDLCYGLYPVITTDDPDVDVDIPWYCWIASFGILGSLGLIITGILNIIGYKLAQSFAKDAIANILGKGGFSGVNIASVPNVEFKNVTIVPDCLTLSGTLDIQLPEKLTPSISLQDSLITKSSQILSSGVFKSRDRCPEGDYPYEELSQSQLATYKVIPQLLGYPLVYEWKISAGRMIGLIYTQSAEVTIPNQANGIVAIPKIETHYPLPLPDGIFVTQNVTLDYTIANDTITLKNAPKDNNYYFWLHVKVTDPLGNTAEKVVQGHFEGDDIKFDGSYEEDMYDCLDRLNQKLKEKSFMARRPLFKNWIFPNYPGPDKLASFVNILNSSGLLERDEMLAHVRLLFGKSFHKAFSKINEDLISLPVVDKRKL